MKLIDKVELRPIEEIKPYGNNPKEHPPEQIDKLVKSIKEYGFDQPVVVDEDGVIIKGHGRLKASKKIGLEEIPIIKREDLDKMQVRGSRIADNKVAESEWDYEALAAEFDELDFKDYDLDATGFEEDKIDEIWQDLEPEMKAEEDDFDKELEEEGPAITELGDLIKLGRHRLLCGDSTDKKDINKLMNDHKADMVFTDPPYGMFLDADFSDMKGIANGNKYKNVKGDHDDFKPELITSIFDNFDYCKEVFLWGADYYAELIPNRNEGCFIVWDKMQGGEGVNDSYDKMFGSNFELCWSKAKHKRAIARVLWKGIFGLNDDSEDLGKRVHPTQKPIKLCSWFLKKFGNENEIVVDLFGGSGSTLITCEQLNRVCYMMELDEKYCDIIIQRYINYRLDNNLDVDIKVNGEEVDYHQFLD